MHKKLNVLFSRNKRVHSSQLRVASDVRMYTMIDLYEDFKDELKTFTWVSQAGTTALTSICRSWYYC